MTLPLDNAVTRYVGDISYSLYLWHFPVVVLALAFYPDAGAVYAVVVLAVTAVLSVASYHLVEDPVRHSRWLEPRWRRAFLQGPTNHSTRLANTWLAIGVVAAVGLTALALKAPTPGNDAPVLSAAPRSSSVAGSRAASSTGTGAAEAYLQERIQQSLDFTDFPDLKPKVDSLGLVSWFDEARDYGCVEVTAALLDDCVYGDPDATGTAVVMGDSFAIAYMPALREALGKRFRVHQLTFEECPPFDAKTVHFSGKAFPECGDFRRFSWDTVDDIDPDLVVIASSYVYSEVAMASGKRGDAALNDEIQPGFERAVREVSAPGRIVTILGPPPGSGNLQECYTAVAKPSDCERDVPSAWYDMTDLEKRVAEATGAQYVDPRGWFCVDQFCPAFVGTTPVYADGGHITNAYSRQIADAVFDGLLTAAEAAQTADGSGKKGGGRKGGKGGKNKGGGKSSGGGAGPTSEADAAPAAPALPSGVSSTEAPTAGVA